MRKYALLLTAAAALTMSNAQAEGREFAQIYTECGLGAMIAPNHEAVAAVTNVTWDLGTTAISSNISSPDTCQGGKARTAAFIYKTYPQLEAELAKGDGEHLATLLSISGCAGDAQAQVVAGLRTDLANSASSADYASRSREQHAEALYDQLNQRVGDSCAI